MNTTIEGLKARRDRLRTGFAELQRRAAEMESDHGKKAEALRSRITVGVGELADIDAEIASAEARALKAELLELTAEMDSDGTTPATEERLFQILAEGRMRKCVGQSYEACRLMTERIRQPDRRGNFGMRWSVFAQWFHLPAEAKASAA